MGLSNAGHVFVTNVARCVKASQRICVTAPRMIAADARATSAGVIASVCAKRVCQRSESNVIVDTDAEAAPEFQCEEEELYHGLVLGTRDYLQKCGFRSAVLGLSGGIDSAITAVIGAAAIGPENIVCVTMPNYRNIGLSRIEQTNRPFDNLI